MGIIYIAVLRRSFARINRDKKKRPETQKASGLAPAKESAWQDSNLRPLRPERSALPSWATRRRLVYYATIYIICQAPKGKKYFSKNLNNYWQLEQFKIWLFLSDEVTQIWNLSSAGRASALQAEGHRFEPYRFHSMWSNSHLCLCRHWGMPAWRNWQTHRT